MMRSPAMMMLRTANMRTLSAGTGIALSQYQRSLVQQSQQRAFTTTQLLYSRVRGHDSSTSSYHNDVHQQYDHYWNHDKFQRKMKSMCKEWQEKNRGEYDKWAKMWKEYAKKQERYNRHYYNYHHHRHNYGGCGFRRCGGSSSLMRTALFGTAFGVFVFFGLPSVFVFLGLTVFALFFVRLMFSPLFWFAALMWFLFVSHNYHHHSAYYYHHGMPPCCSSTNTTNTTSSSSNASTQTPMSMNETNQWCHRWFPHCHRGCTTVVPVDSRPKQE